jgi:hypothetical protein
VTVEKVDRGINPRGGRRAGSGRKKGVPNRLTADVREALASLAKGNIGKAQTWLDRTAKKDPGRALDLYLRLLEYHVPKLARSEISGPNGTALVPPAIIVPRKDLPGETAAARNPLAAKPKAG